jgi:hypothetical protein
MGSRAARMKAVLDFELALPVGFVLFATAGLVYAAFAAYIYVRFERSTPDMHVPVGLSAFTMYYVLVFGILRVRGEYLLSLLLLFGMPLILVLVIWLGSQARSKAGIRMALAGGFTLAAFACGIGHYIYQSTTLSWR